MQEEVSKIPSTRFKTPSDISTELSGASQRLSQDKQQAEAERKNALDALAKRQAEVQNIFDKGKKLYWDGK